jgi:hypothetical protein
MHPSIAELVRAPLYPELQNHPSVVEYPEVDGMRDRLFWLNHQEKEDPRVPQAVSLSRTNTFEVNMIAALVSHLIRQGTYGNEDIAVITPYLGQLQKIKKRLAGSFEIVVGDRDVEDLEARGLQEDIETSTEGQIQPQKMTLLKALRIATVDNFQGEEANMRKEMEEVAAERLEILTEMEKERKSTIKDYYVKGLEEEQKRLDLNTLKKSHKRSIIVLNFRSVQGQRIKEMQADLIIALKDMHTVRDFSDIAGLQAKLDAQLHTYGRLESLYMFFLS